MRSTPASTHTGHRADWKGEGATAEKAALSAFLMAWQWGMTWRTWAQKASHSWSKVVNWVQSPVWVPRCRPVIRWTPSLRASSRMPGRLMMPPGTLYTRPPTTGEVQPAMA